MKQTSLFKRLGIRLLLMLDIPVTTISRLYSVSQVTVYRVKNKNKK